jgi:archaea-specific DNA-binding protein
MEETQRTTPEELQPETTNESKEDNIVFVGNKTFPSYIKSITFQFTKGEKDEVVIKARGKYITRAVDLAEVMKKRQIEDKDIIVKEINIGSEEHKNANKQNVSVSAIDIILAKQN